MKPCSKCFNSLTHLIFITSWWGSYYYPGLQKNTEKDLFYLFLIYEVRIVGEAGGRSYESPPVRIKHCCWRSSTVLPENLGEHINHSGTALCESVTRLALKSSRDQMAWKKDILIVCRAEDEEKERQGTEDPGYLGVEGRGMEQMK